MNKLFFTLLSIFGLALTAFAQETQTIFENDKVLITGTTTLDCNPHNNAIPNTHMFLTYTNKTKESLEFNFEVELWYNFNGTVTKSDLSPKDMGDEPLLKSIYLEPGASKTGVCENSSPKYKVFFKHNNPKMDIILSDIQIKVK